MQVLKHHLGGRAPESPNLPTLDDALPLEPIFKKVAHEAKARKNQKKMAEGLKRYVADENVAAAEDERRRLRIAS